MSKNMNAVVFDFDNCIVLKPDGTGSEEVKDGAWQKVFAEEWDKLKDEFPALIKRWSGGTGSRFEIVRDALTHLQFQGDTEKEVQRLCARFNQLVQDGIVALGVLPETRAFLETTAKRLPLFINSATPSVAMNETLEKLGIRHFFREVYGQEGGKTENIRRAMQAVGERNPKKIVFVGDSLTDYEAAEEVGCRFVGVATKRNKWNESTQPFLVVWYIHELEQYIKV